MIKKTVLIIIICFLTLFIGFDAKARTLQDIQNEIDAAQKKLNDTNTKKAMNSQDLATTNKKISEIKSSITQTENEIKQKEEESKKLEEDIKNKNEEIKDLMRYYQISSSGSVMLEYIMGAKSISDLIYRLSITEQITSYNKKMIKQMQDLIEKNEQIKKELTSKKEELSKLKSEMETQLIVLNQKQAELSKEGESETQAIKTMQKEINYYKSLGCSLSDTISGCYSKKYGTGYLPSGTTFYRPTTFGTISSEFGNRLLFGKSNNHFAIDIAVPVGTPVYSVAPGVVGITNYSCGNAVVVWHNINGTTYSSYYCHLSSIKVKKGDVVTKDTVIALSGNTGVSTGPHLHLGLATGKYYDDYYNYYGNTNSFQSHTFNPRNVITFPSLGSSYSNR